MFSADTPSHTHSTRSKRTRQVAGTDDSVKLPLTKKRRSALRRDTFEPLTDASLNEIAGREKQVEKVNGHVNEPAKQLVRTTSQAKELTLRGVKKTEKRAEKGGGQLTLSSNDFYSVAQLPSLPDQIRCHPSMPISCVISPDYDYILALTHTDALVWPYSSSASVPSPRDLVAFKLPFPPANADDPLPLATFTARSANGEPGIVVVSPKWGRIVYWESITNASSFVPGQTSSGVQGSVPGMSSGETIQELIGAEPAGFIITFNRGRVAHLTVRDQMGRPGIGVQFLRKSTAASVRGGIFGSIRHVFGGDRRNGVPMVRTGKSSKAQRDVIICTEDGEFEFWDTNLSVGNSLRKTMVAREELLSALQPHVGDIQPGQLKILDFETALTPASGREIARHPNADLSSMVILLSTSSQGNAVYFLVELVLSDEAVNIKEVHQIKGFSQASSSAWRPRLCIPKPRTMAFVLFETAVALVSLTRIKETPSSQLLMEKAGPPERFQDCFRFQDDSIYKVLACAGEEHDGHAACVFAVQGFGVVRVVSKLQDDEVDVEDIETGVGPKTRIEQAIFFGTLRQNPLELSKPAGEDFPPEDIEAAVLSISNEVVSSTSKYLPKTAPSIENHMRLRAKALEDLADHTLKHYASALTRKTRFQLLWNAEKLAAAQAVWKVQEKIQRSYPRKDDREMTYLNFALRALHESRQNYPNAEKGEQDHVRHWLINSVPKVDHLMTELSSSLKELDDMDVKDPRIVCDYLIEAVDLWNATYQTAFRFREDHASVYGLGDEVFEDGVLQTGYPSGLPQPWTSGPEQFQFGQRLVYHVCTFLREWWDYNPAVNGKIKGKKSKEIPTDIEGKPYDAPSKEAMLDLASRLPTEVELFSRITKEENLQAQANVKLTVHDQSEQKKQIAALKKEIRPRLVQAISVIARFNPPGAIRLAEKLKDPGLLVTLNTEYLTDLEKEAHLHPEDRQMIEQKIKSIQDHVETYFDKFGNPWAFAHFSNLIDYGNLGRILSEAQANKGQKQKYLTWFLRKSDKLGQRVGKLSWINDVIGERRFDRAQQTLEKVASGDEDDVWAKKTELCLAKLAGLAAAEGSEQPKNTSLTDLSTKYDSSLALLELQEFLVVHMSSSVSDAIDEKAARDLAMDIFASRLVEKTSVLKRLLIVAIDSVLANQSLSLTSLVSLLTLMNPIEFAGQPEDDPGIQDHEIALALQAVDLCSSSTTMFDSSLSSTDLDALRMLIWRRCIIRDDWVMLNNTAGKSDREVMDEMYMSSLFKTLLEVFQRHYETQPTTADAVDLVSPTSLFSPQEILDTKTLLPASLREQYLDSVGIEANSSEGKKFLEQLQKELDAEQTKLKRFVDKAQLGMHWEGMLKEAERIVREWNGLGDGDENDDDAAAAAESEHANMTNGTTLENGDTILESVEG